MTHLDQEELERKVRKVNSLSETQREMLMEAGGHLVDLSPEALEFLLDIIEQLRPHDSGKPLDPMPAMAVAAAKYRARRKKN